MDTCGKCKTTIEKHDQFHVFCTILNENEFNYLKSSKNIKLMCDYCSTSGLCYSEKSEIENNITSKMLKQFEMQENLLLGIQTLLRRLENDRKSVSSNQNAKDITPSTSQTGKLYGYISKHKKLLIPGVLAVMALLIVSIIVGSEALNGSKSKLVLGNSEESRTNIPINSTIDTNSNNVDGDDECFGNGTLCLMERDVWRAHPQKNKMDMQKLPLHRAIISHTASEACDTPKICFERVRVIQEFHMNSLGWDDIGYNFLISSDGRVYVGRGWDAVGAHTLGYNRDSVGISFIGTYMTTPPTEAQLNACRALLEEGVRLKKLIANYHLYGARQFQATESPGDMLYKKIKKWEHWSADINPH